jgi:tyrosyl-tRNA synthetase
VETGLASSKAEARRGIQASGYSVNGARVVGADQSVGASELLADRYVALQKGKKNFAFLELV